MILNEELVAAALRVQRNARKAVVDAAGTESAVVVAAPAGAGKSHFIAESLGYFRSKRLRVVAVSPTNEQAFSLVEYTSRLNPAQDVVFMPASGVTLPAGLAARANVNVKKAQDVANDRDPLVIATIDKLCYSIDNGLRFDVLLMDEAYQASAAKYYTAAGAAPTHLLVGDSGQLDPFSTFDDAVMWRGGPEDPLQTAVGVLLRNHDEIEPFRMPITRRLDPRALPMARAFYPGHAFDAAVLPGARKLELGAASGRVSAIDKALEVACESGWAHVTLPGASVIRNDSETASTIVGLIGRLLAREATWRDEDTRKRQLLRPTDVVVGVSHNDQKDVARALLDEAGLDDVAVETANRLQGLTYQVTVVWHPLAGSESADAFHLDPGRLCVLLTRHRHACIVVGRETDRALLEGIPPATPAYLGWRSDPVLDGWSTHEAIFTLLEPHHVPF